MDLIREAWGPVVPVVVDRPVANVIASLNRLGWWQDEQERAESTAHLIAARDQALAGTTTVRVDFEALRAAPADVIRRLADELGLAVTEAQLKAAAESVMKPADVPRDVDPHQRFIDLLTPEVTRNSGDAHSVSMLAQVYFHAGDFANARKWFARMIEIGGSDEGIFWAMLRVAQSMEMLGEPWPDVQDAYLRAWEFRPTRAEPLYDIARHYIAEKRCQLGYLFAVRAAEIPLPEDDMTIPHPDIYAWRTTFQQLVCAYHIDKQAEAFALSRRLLARPDIPDDDRQGIASIRDFDGADDAGGGIVVPRCVGAQPHRWTTRRRGHRQPGRRRGSSCHRRDAELVSALLHRRVTGRTLPGGRRRPVGRRPRDTA